MAKYNLLPNESLILKSENVKHGGMMASFSDELILTNLNIIHISKGFFGNVKDVVRYPVNQIKIYNGEPQVILSKQQGGTNQLDIFFQNGQKSFEFQSSGKKEIIQWINAIYKLLTGKEYSVATSAIPGTEYVAKTLKDTVDVFKNVFGIKNKTNEIGLKTTSVKVTKKCISCSAPLSGVQGQVVRCIYCDTEQVL